MFYIQALAKEVVLGCIISATCILLSKLQSAILSHVAKLYLHKGNVILISCYILSFTPKIIPKTVEFSIETNKRTGKDLIL